METFALSFLAAVNVIAALAWITGTIRVNPRP